MKITASYTSEKRGISLTKELVFDMSLFELVNCKSIKSVLKTIRAKAEGYGILKNEEVNGAEFSDQTLIEEWKAYRKSVKGLIGVLNLVLSRWTLGETHGIGHWKRVYENGMRLMSEETDPAVLQYSPICMTLAVKMMEKTNIMEKELPNGLRPYGIPI